MIGSGFVPRTMKDTRILQVIAIVCIMFVITQLELLIIPQKMDTISLPERTIACNITQLETTPRTRLNQTTTAADWSKHAFNHSESMKLIYLATESYLPLTQTKFDHCQYKNCYTKAYTPNTWYSNADLVIFDIIMAPHEVPDYIPWQQRQNQIWIAYGMESPGYEGHQWPSKMVDKKFNGTMTYRVDSTLYYPYGRYAPLPKDLWDNTVRNYASTKTKGAFAYVSNCNAQYPRLDVIKEIGKYIPVDLFGKCSGVQPCSWANFTCESNLHKEYRFYIGLENTLCKDYVSEKVFSRMDSTMVPIAMGGLSMEEYKHLLPPESFLHVYNFTNIEALGKHLQKLMSNDDAYNQYHQWRGKYVKQIHPLFNATPCELCDMANVKPSLPTITNLSAWWNNDTCRSYQLM